MRVHVPPIKCQGIKTKLVPSILHAVDRDPDGLWIEPFLGSAVVALNVMPKRALLADSNPHLIRFYCAIQDGDIDGPKTRGFLEQEGSRLASDGQDYYNLVRARFNSNGDPLDFLFLNRSCFNGLIRFNRYGRFNVPFGHKKQRFAPAYVTKIVNQVERFREALELFDWRFACQDFRVTLAGAEPGDFVYCDPPYVGRHVDYYDSWDAQSERSLHDALSGTAARFMLSTWHSNEYRENHYLQTLWSRFTIRTRQHFYHVGAREANRKPMLEALVTNYVPAAPLARARKLQEQLLLFERDAGYGETADVTSAAAERPRRGSPSAPPAAATAGAGAGPDGYT